MLLFSFFYFSYVSMSESGVLILHVCSNTHVGTCAPVCSCIWNPTVDAGNHPGLLFFLIFQVRDSQSNAELSEMGSLVTDSLHRNPQSPAPAL